ncbi:hypothetical protein SRABI36_00175 [Pedobacter sp. Bi36]|nr:hypothetical protein SRABI36_00175 [Pedobacter sp. Bi36]CAH0181491.1 hypothetical protein SRABI126_01271 [Pedobacter sp. Bi126]
MTKDKDQPGIADLLMSKELLEHSKKLISNSNLIIKQLELQLHYCKSLVKSFSVRNNHYP